MLKRIFFFFFPQFKKSEDYVKELKGKGIRIGQGTHFFGPATNEIDVQRPWMLKIGEYCKITSGVKILTHDYSRSVLRRRGGGIIGEAGETIIGDNVFVGMNSIILMGTQIGNNVIVGAGSVVSGHVPSDCVVAGNPAKVIRSLKEHYELRNSKYVEEAVLYYNKFFEYYHREPSVREMGPFWYLFLPRKRDALKKEKILTNLSGDEREDIIKEFLSSHPIFDDFDTFKQYCVSITRTKEKHSI